MAVTENQMNVVYLLLGSNLGERRRYLESASARLVGELLPECMQGKRNEAVKCSSVYETEPWGFESMNRFLNMAMMLYTELEPLQVLNLCKEIEQKLGREKHDVERDGNGRRIYTSRTIDIDILLFYRDGEPVVMDDKELTIPHPKMAERLFALEPLAEIAGELRHPVLKTSINEMLGRCMAQYLQ